MGVETAFASLGKWVAGSSIYQEITGKKKKTRANTGNVEDAAEAERKKRRAVYLTENGEMGQEVDSVGAVGRGTLFGN